MSAVLLNLAARLATATNPVTFLASLSTRGWIGLVFVSGILYLRQISTLSNSGKDAPCPPFGVVFRVLYGLFGTRLAEMVLGRMLHTPESEPQAEQAGGTTATTVGDPDLRIMMVPILGGAFGGNYGFLVWDEADEERRAIAIDPADPWPMLRAAKAEALSIRMVLTTHWHFDHSSGNSTLKRQLGKDLMVVAGAGEIGRTPAVTHRMKDEEVLDLGRLRVRGHAVPGHTRGSMVYEVYNAASPADKPTIAFTGDTLFCGGCGALFECSSMTLYRSLQRLVTERLGRQTQLFPGHEYTEMLLQQAVKREPGNAAARVKLQQTRVLRARKLPTLPSTVEEELTYNAQLRASPAQLALMCGCAMPDEEDNKVE